ncbi:MAG: cytochrome c family protein [Alphaproteobacteria bacterium]|nr:cytochrome c family protein [Alphaproteobacteria bacterium]
MSSFDLNKVMMAILIALILSLLSGIIAEKLVSPKKLAQNSFVVEGVEDDASSSSTQTQDDVLEPVAALMVSANVENGQKLAKQCLQCHSFEKGGANKIGPNLWNVVGNKHGHLDGYAYSSSLLKKEGKWDYENLNHFLYKPKVYSPGTKMSFVGLKKVQDRADIIAYLRTLSDSPVALPTP